MCLNPYSNGLPSRGMRQKLTAFLKAGLNPYSNGLPSRGPRQKEVGLYLLQVLIPILMDYPLGVHDTKWSEFL